MSQDRIYADEISNTVMDALGDIADGVRVQQEPTEGDAEVER